MHIYILVVHRNSTFECSFVRSFFYLFKKSIHEKKFSTFTALSIIRKKRFMIHKVMQHPETASLFFTFISIFFLALSLCGQIFHLLGSVESYM